MKYDESSIWVYYMSTMIHLPMVTSQGGGGGRAWHSHAAVLVGPAIIATFISPGTWVIRVRGFSRIWAFFLGQWDDQTFLNGVSHEILKRNATCLKRVCFFSITAKLEDQAFDRIYLSSKESLKVPFVFRIILQKEKNPLRLKSTQSNQCYVMLG